MELLTVLLIPASRRRAQELWLYPLLGCSILILFVHKLLPLGCLRLNFFPANVPGIADHDTRTNHDPVLSVRYQPQVHFGGAAFRGWHVPQELRLGKRCLQYDTQTDRLMPFRQLVVFLLFILLNSFCRRAEEIERPHANQQCGRL
jgi:hypothetical protein